MRRTRSAVGNMVKAITFPVSSAVLRTPLGQWMLNRMLERFGRPVNALIQGATVTREFTWTCRFKGRVFRLPVGPRWPRSWFAARMWRHPKYVPIRRFFEIVIDTLPPGIYFDFGANDGLYTYPLAAHGYQCSCFEPQASCAAFIRTVCELNEFSNVDVVEAAVGDQDGGSVEFFVAEPSTSHGAGPTSPGELNVPVEQLGSLVRSSVERFHSATAVRVDVVSLDGHCRRTGRDPDLLKIDVEGWEWNTLCGGRETLERCRPTLMIEITVEENRERIWDLMHSLGYRAFALPYWHAPIRPIDTKQALSNAGEENFVFARQPRLLAALQPA